LKAPQINGLETPDKGEIRVGESVKLGYVDQSRDALKPDLGKRELISRLPR
jgi:ATPase subunit of ABC transporter with duplicated ATPase domains